MKRLYNGMLLLNTHGVLLKYKNVEKYTLTFNMNYVQTNKNLISVFVYKCQNCDHF